MPQRDGVATQERFWRVAFGLIYGRHLGARRFCRLFDHEWIEMNRLMGWRRCRTCGHEVGRYATDLAKETTNA